MTSHRLLVHVGALGLIIGACAGGGIGRDRRLRRRRRESDGWHDWYGGVAGTGGVTGVAGTGGATPTGGATGVAGVTGTGGVVGTGGATPTGGAVGTGGQSGAGGVVDAGVQRTRWAAEVRARAVASAEADGAAPIRVGPEWADLQAPAGGPRIPPEEPAGPECRLWQTGEDYDQYRLQDDHEQRGLAPARMTFPPTTT